MHVSGQGATLSSWSRQTARVLGSNTPARRKDRRPVMDLYCTVPVAEDRKISTATTRSRRRASPASSRVLGDANAVNYGGRRAERSCARDRNRAMRWSRAVSLDTVVRDPETGCPCIAA
ncbi:hypothetical protein ACPA9J_08235 [Pseudomonas aeruginosa]